MIIREIVGVIVFVVCFVAFLMLHSRRQGKR